VHATVGNVSVLGGDRYARGGVKREHGRYGAGISSGRGGCGQGTYEGCRGGLHLET
jgi:hypothetical protein